MNIEVHKLSQAEADYVTSLFAPSERETVSKMAETDPNECFDSCFFFLQDSPRQSAEKSAVDDDGGIAENRVLDDVFPFMQVREVQKSVQQVAAGIDDLRQRNRRMEQMEQTIEQLRQVVEKMSQQTVADTVRDEDYVIYGEDSPADDSSIFDSLLPARLPAMAG